MQDFDRTGGNRLHFCRAQTNSACIRTQEEVAVTPQETETDLPASIGGSPAEVGAAVAHHRDKDTGSRSSGK